MIQFGLFKALIEGEVIKDVIGYLSMSTLCLQVTKGMLFTVCAVSEYFTLLPDQIPFNIQLWSSEELSSFIINAVECSHGKYLKIFVYICKARQMKGTERCSKTCIWVFEAFMLFIGPLPQNREELDACFTWLASEPCQIMLIFHKATNHSAKNCFCLA